MRETLLILRNIVNNPHAIFLVSALARSDEKMDATAIDERTTCKSGGRNLSSGEHVEVSGESIRLLYSNCQALLMLTAYHFWGAVSYLNTLSRGGGKCSFTKRVVNFTRFVIFCQ